MKTVAEKFTEEEAKNLRQFTMDETDAMSYQLLFVYAVMDAIKASFGGTDESMMDGGNITVLLSEGIAKLKEVKAVLDR